jgi:hypothetical protein
MNTMAPVAYDAAAERRHLALRDEFLLDPDVVFLNHGSFGACPRPVFERYQAWQVELERQPVEFLGRRQLGLLAEARQSLADYLGAGHDDVVYVSNVTTALNVVARSLPLQAGDEILTTDHEYGALERTWTFVAEHRQARIVPASLPIPLSDPAEVVEAVWAKVTPRTRVLFLSHITSPTAVTLPIQPLIARARAAGIWTVVDGAHAPGQIDVNLRELGVGFYGGNCHYAQQGRAWERLPRCAKQNRACGRSRRNIRPTCSGAHGCANVFESPAALALRLRDWPATNQSPRPRYSSVPTAPRHRSSQIGVDVDPLVLCQASPALVEPVAKSGFVKLKERPTKQTKLRVSCSAN